MIQRRTTNRFWPANNNRIHRRGHQTPLKRWQKLAGFLAILVTTTLLLASAWTTNPTGQEAELLKRHTQEAIPATTAHKNNAQPPIRCEDLEARTTAEAYHRGDLIDVVTQKAELLKRHTQQEARPTTTAHKNNAQPNTTLENLEARTDAEAYRRGDLIDVVMPWVNDSWTAAKNNIIIQDASESWDEYRARWDWSKVTDHYAGVGMERPTWSEVCFTVRAMLHWDTENLIRRVHIVYNGWITETGPPECLRGVDRVVFVPYSTLLRGTSADSPEIRLPDRHVAWSNVHRIPDILPWALWVEDDMFLNRPLDMSDFFDFTTSKIRTHMTGGHSGLGLPGQRETADFLAAVFPGGASQHMAALHCPEMVQIGLQREIAERFGEELFRCAPKQPGKELVATHDGKCGCRFPRVYMPDFLTQFAIHRNKAIHVGGGSGFASEIHTNGGGGGSDLLARLQRQAAQSAWLNVQGDGISDEYRGNVELRGQFDTWLATLPFSLEDRHFPTGLKRQMIE